MRITLAIAVGGAFGSLARYWLGAALLGASAAFPVGTLLVNVVGSFALGALAGGWPTTAHPTLRAGLTVGACGGFTTFSTFSLEVVALAERGAMERAAAYAAASVALSVVAALAGVVVGRALAGAR